MSETLKPPSQEFNLPSAEEIIGLTHKLQDLIRTDSNAHYEHILGYGDGQALEVDFPDGSKRELVWIDKEEGRGILAWSDKSKLSYFIPTDRWNLIHVSSDKSVQFTGIFYDERYPGSRAEAKFVDWVDFCNLLSLAQQLEEA